MSERLFLGSIKERNTKFGSIWAMWLKKEDIEKILENRNADGGINIDIKPSKSGGMYAEINTYMADRQSSGSGTGNQNARVALPQPPDATGEDLPF